MKRTVTRLPNSTLKFTAMQTGIGNLGRQEMTLSCVMRHGISLTIPTINIIRCKSMSEQLCYIDISIRMHLILPLEENRRQMNKVYISLCNGKGKSTFCHSYQRRCFHQTVGRLFPWNLQSIGMPYSNCCFRTIATVGLSYSLDQRERCGSIKKLSKISNRGINLLHYNMQKALLPVYTWSKGFSCVCSHYKKSKTPIEKHPIICVVLKNFVY